MVVGLAHGTLSPWWDTRGPQQSQVASRHLSPTGERRWRPAHNWGEAHGTRKPQGNLMPWRWPLLPSYYGEGSGSNHPGSSERERLKPSHMSCFLSLNAYISWVSREAGVRRGPSGPKPEDWENQNVVPFSAITTEKATKRRKISMDSIEEPKSSAGGAQHQLDTNRGAARWCNQRHLFEGAEAYSHWQSWNKTWWWII